jgi:hypothetical protein
MNFRRSTSGGDFIACDNRTLAATVEEGTAPKRVIWKTREPNAVARSQVTAGKDQHLIYEKNPPHNSRRALQRVDL